MDRKIIQISTCHDGEKNESPFVHALCDDGTVWVTDTLNNWHALPPIPQEDPHSD